MINTTVYTTDEAASVVADLLNDTEGFIYLSDDSFVAVINTILEVCSVTGGCTRNGSYRQDNLQAAVEYVASIVTRNVGKDMNKLGKAIVARCQQNA